MLVRRGAAVIPVVCGVETFARVGSQPSRQEAADVHARAAVAQPWPQTECAGDIQLFPFSLWSAPGARTRAMFHALPGVGQRTARKWWYHGCRLGGFCVGGGGVRVEGLGEGRRPVGKGVGTWDLVCMESQVNW